MLMIEGSGDQVPEARFIEALEFAHGAIQPIIATIKQLAAEHGKPKQQFKLHTCDPKVFAIIDRVARAKVTEAVKAKNKQERSIGVGAAEEEAVAALKRQGGLDRCFLKFYRHDDLGDDGVWDNWRLEGPAFVWHYRGAPHVHVWVNVAARVPGGPPLFRVGERPPDFTLSDAAGRPVSLADYEGKKPVVLVFYRGEW